MTGYVHALIARMLWAGMQPKLVAERTGEPLPDVQAIAHELARPTPRVASRP